MRSFGKSFAKTVRLVSLADDAVIKSDDVYGKPFGEVWEEYQRTLNKDLLQFSEEPFEFEIKVVRSNEEQQVIDKALKDLSMLEKTKDPTKLSSACRKVIEATLVAVHNCSDFPDLSTDFGRKEAVELIMAHGHGLSLYLTLQQYENRGLVAATNLKKS